MGQKNGQVYQWAPKGTRPRQAADQRCESAYIFGAVCPEHDKGAALVMPRANAEAMQKHLEEISASVAVNAHGVVIMPLGDCPQSPAGNRWRGVAQIRRAEHPGEPLDPVPAALFSRTESDRKHLAVPATNLPLQPRVRNLGGNRRCLLRCLEPTDRRNRPHQINRNPKLGGHRSMNMRVGISVIIIIANA